jgi:hypothetical protein
MVELPSFGGWDRSDGGRGMVSKCLFYQQSNFDVLAMGQGTERYSPDPEKVYV